MLYRNAFVILILLMLLPAITPSAIAQPSHAKGHADEAAIDETAPDSPLPPGIKERVFIHVPRSPKPGHLGTCTITTSDTVGDYGLTGWHLPSSGVTWFLSTATIPSDLSATAQAELTNAFGTWNTQDPSKKFFYGGPTSVRKARLDFVNTVMWGRISAGAIAITYVRYYTSTGEVADVDTVFNSRYPWAVFYPAGGECQSSPDAYDLRDIATHELGHWIGLDDLYSVNDQDLTMYGYGAGGELKKRDLGAGDKAGLGAVAP